MTGTGQFECWNGLREEDVTIQPNEKPVYDKIHSVARKIYDAPMSADPTGGADHYNNPDKEGYPSWTNNCQRLSKVGNHQFYKGLT